MRIRSVPLAAVKPGALLVGPQLIFADMGHQIDNMEGLSVHRAADGAMVLTLISDDNFSLLQRTVLLQFTLVGEYGGAAQLAAACLLLDDRALELAHACGASSSSLAFSRKASSPPRWSTVFSALAETRSLTERLERVGDQRDVQQVRQEPPFGLDVGVAHLVADQRHLPVRSQRRDMAKPLELTRRRRACEMSGLAMDRGRIVTAEKGVKASAAAMTRS